MLETVFVVYQEVAKSWALHGTRSLCSAELRDFKSLSRATYVQKMLRISDVSWYQDRQADQAEQGDLESERVSLPPVATLPCPPKEGLVCLICVSVRFL